MNPFVQQILSSFVRWALVGIAGWLVQHGIWQQGDVAGYVTGGTALVIGLLWSLWQKYHARIKFLTALESPAGTSEAAVVAKVANGTGATL